MVRILIYRMFYSDPSSVNGTTVILDWKKQQVYNYTVRNCSLFLTQGREEIQFVSTIITRTSDIKLNFVACSFNIKNLFSLIFLANIFENLISGCICMFDCLFYIISSIFWADK